MTELKREDLINTKWDVRDWSEEQKTLWQEKCFELGFSWWCVPEAVSNQDATHYWLEQDLDILYISDSDHDYFLRDEAVQKQFSDMFPEYEIPKPIDVVEEIRQLFIAKMGKEDFEGGSDEDEDERGFDGLVYVEPRLIEKYYVILLSDLSEAQILFLEDNLQFHPNGGSEKDEDIKGLASERGEGDWFFYSSTSPHDTRISFNQLFKYEDEL